MTLKEVEGEREELRDIATRYEQAEPSLGPALWR